jgi:hypothetical protein
MRSISQSIQRQNDQKTEKCLGDIAIEENDIKTTSAHNFQQTEVY